MNDSEIQRLALGDYADRNLPQIYPEKFYTDIRNNPTDPLNPIKIDMCRWVKRGSPGSGVVHAISKLQKMPGHWQIIAPFYEAWKKGHETPVDGTPLTAWPGCRPEDAERLNLLRIYTVQGVASMTDDIMDRLGMGSRDLRDRALAFLAAGNQAKAAGEQKRLHDELDATKAQLAEAMAAIAELRAQLPQTAPPVALPSRRGRPPKAA